MKRIVFTFFSLLIGGLFAFLYYFQPIRDFLTGANVGFLVEAYNQLDAFFNFLWNKTLNNFILLNPTFDNINFKGLVIIIICTFLFILAIDIIASIISTLVNLSKHKQEIRIQEEQEKLENINKAPKYFSILDANEINFSNVKTPSSASEIVLNPFIEQNTAKIQLNSGKRNPIGRIIFLIIYLILLSFFIFFRFSYLAKFSWLLNTFKNFYSSAFITAINTNLDSFFTNLFTIDYQKVIYKTFYLGHLYELILYLVTSLIFIIIVLLITHFILISYRKRKLEKEKRLPTVEDQKISNKALEILTGEKELQNGEINLIADITPSIGFLNKEKDFVNQAKYLDDISTGVTEKGIAVNPYKFIKPSKTRQPFILEDLPEDLSKNKGVKIDDIPSIDVVSKNDEINTTILTTYLNDDEKDKINDFDFTKLDLSNLIIKNKPLPKKTITVDDQLSLDEDGLIYLVKRGKRFTSEEEIADLVSYSNLSENNLINKIGNDNFKFLNNLEPFKLKTLNVSEEINNIKTRIKQEEKEKEEEALIKATTSKPFNV